MNRVPHCDVPLLELANVTVERETTTILDRVCVTIPSGRHTAVLGPNGSGKSSLLKVLSRQFYPSVESDGGQGEVRILGRNDWDVSELKQKMGIVTSSLDASFSRGRTGRMTALQAVASGFNATELPEFAVPLTSERRASVMESLDQVGALRLAERRVETMSTGERRRVLIARALVHRPSILVLDEPTSGLDLVAAASFLMVLRALLGKAGLTLLLVTHHVNEILPEIEHLVLLDQGKVCFDGDKKNGLTGERLTGLYGVPIGVMVSESGFYSARTL